MKTYDERCNEDRFVDEPRGVDMRGWLLHPADMTDAAIQREIGRQPITSASTCPRLAALRAELASRQRTREVTP